MKLPRSSHTASHLHFWHHHTPSEINLFLTRKRTGRIPVLSNKILYFSKTVSKMILAATYNITHRLPKTATLTLITPNLFKARRTRSNTRSKIRNPNRKWSTNRLRPSYPTVLFLEKIKGHIADDESGKYGSSGNDQLFPAVSSRYKTKYPEAGNSQYKAENKAADTNQIFF